ncbi:MAG: methyltransferase domain-containing protein [Nitrospirae bacterium]|nr:methyltransferase domain-containing protein [Nitrospirota bacterium]
MSNIAERVREIRKIWGGFQSARVLLTANNYRVFDYLIKPQSAKNISSKLKADLRAAEILLDALTGMGLLKKHTGRYKNSSLTAQFLVAGRPYYQGDIIKHADTLWQNWSGLDHVLKTGEPYHKAHNHEAFIFGMHNLAVLKAENIIDRVGLKGVKTALDLGGGPGTYAMEMAKRGVKVTLFDRPETVKIAKKVINNPSLILSLNKGRTGGVKFIQGDFIHDDIGKGYDLIFISQILHSMSETDNISVLKKCKKALNADGRIVIQEFNISNDRTQPQPSALFSINMLVNTEGGRCYSSDELKHWLGKIGFKKIKKQIVEDCVIVSANDF